MRRKYVFTESIQEYKQYTSWNFVIDVSMVLLTGGLWFAWIGFREMKKR